MEYIPSSPAEVKNIIEAVNFKTLSRFTYLKGDGGLCRFPFGVSQDGDKELLFPLDLHDVAGDDPDRDFLLIDPPDLQPGESCYTDAPALYFNRPVKSGEVDELRLAIWRERFAAAAAPEQSRQADKTDRQRSRGEGGLSPLGDILKALPHPTPQQPAEVTQPAPQEVAPPLHSVGRELKLAWLPAELYESPSFRKLKLGDQELYRIFRTYCELAGGESKNSYVSIGIVQAAELLERRKKDLLGSGNNVTRKAAEKISTSESSIKRSSVRLQFAGWIEKPVRGRPREVNPYCNKYLVVKSEKQRLTRILEQKKKVVH